MESIIQGGGWQVGQFNPAAISPGGVLNDSGGERDNVLMWDPFRFASRFPRQFKPQFRQVHLHSDKVIRSDDFAGGNSGFYAVVDSGGIGSGTANFASVAEGLLRSQAGILILESIADRYSAIGATEGTFVGYGSSSGAKKGNALSHA